MSMSVSKCALKTRVLATGVLVGLAATAAVAQQATPPKTSPPDFAANQAGSIPIGQDFLPVPGALPPVAADPAHPYVPNGVGRQPTYRIADLSNPNLKPWVKERMRKDNDEVLAGKVAFTPRASCMPAGVPVFMTYSRFEPIHFIQTPKEVVMIFAGDQQVRHVYLDVPHSANPKPSWYGESVGHYEGDTLVVDTIGQNSKTFVDNYRTPHSEQLHVTERWRLTDGGKALEVRFRVEDPEAFNAPWSAVQPFRRVQEEFREQVCAENVEHASGYLIPVAAKPDF